MLTPMTWAFTRILQQKVIPNIDRVRKRSYKSTLFYCQISAFGLLNNFIHLFFYLFIMAIQNISAKELNNLLEKDTLTRNDRFLIDSYTYTSLVEYCNDLRANEVEKVRCLEEDNIYRYFNACCIILGLLGEDSLHKALISYPMSEIVDALKEEYHGRTLESLIVYTIPKALLDLEGKRKGSQVLKPFFAGEMPQKFMSFRNQTATDWFEGMVGTKLQILSRVYLKSSPEEAVAHLLANTAYQLHHNNPIKYQWDTNLSVNDVVGEIMTRFLNNNGGMPSIVYSKTGDILSKSL